MITEKEIAFLRYWERNREIENSFVSKLTRGFPMALLFGLPIILFVVVVKLFLPEWYMKIAGSSAGAFVAAVIAMIIVIVFYAYFRMQFKWEMNEQLYKELKSKENRINNQINNQTNIH
jgi:amino acid permease